MEENARAKGLALMGVGMLVFLGTNAELLPAAAFWPALGVCILGVIVFMKGNRVATEVAEERTRRALNPQIRNVTTEQFAARQANTDGALLQSLQEREAGGSAAKKAEEGQIEEDELVLYEVDQPNETVGADNSGGFVVTTDVSFPLEVQEQRSLADQLQKLKVLHDEGIISDEELSIAKAKLLS